MCNANFNINRFSGVLLHPTSLPSNFACGSFGDSARTWLKLLSDNGINVWQFLPLSPVDSSGSPYSSPSSFAINPWFLDINDLMNEGFISNKDFEILLGISSHLNTKNHLLDFQIADSQSDHLANALTNLWSKQSSNHHLEFNNWCSKQNWLEDHILFVELRSQYKKLPWWEWPEALSSYDRQSLELWKIQNQKKLLKHSLVQWHLSRQWNALKKLANDLGVFLFGDLPFYVSKDSADVWSNRKLFSVLSNGNTIQQSGVPPDYFSETGQLWGSPTYRWKRHKATKYTWWRNRFKRQWQQVDLLRLDHFRALESFWAVPADEETAQDGFWLPSPGLELLNLLKRDYGNNLPLIAEDLGVITPRVESLRDYFKLPGMKILQFAFDGNLDNPYLPENIKKYMSVVYPGTHDNPTTCGWWEELDSNTRIRISERFTSDDESVAIKLIKIGLETNTCLFISSIQDLLSLGNESRFNKPGTVSNNWSWQLSSFNEEVLYAIEKYGQLARESGRISGDLLSEITT